MVEPVVVSTFCGAVVPRYKVEKLIRDKCVYEPGVNYKQKQLTQVQHLQALKDKLLEEAQELVEEIDRTQTIREFADVYQVLEDLRQKQNISWAEIEEVKQEKFDHAGGFSQGTWCNWVEMELGHRLDKYCRNNPNKYQVIDKK